MSDLLLLGGVVLCALSVILAVIQLIRMEPPRVAAILLCLGIAVMFAGAHLAPGPFQLGDFAGAWDRLQGGEPAAVPAQ
ncbi:hypothetical protein [Paracoccus zhejiangensis]|uniref:Uncharacterized protein n=1 Tax=Paracoccus zhejiangensis TaxID=1077935 RepID=A0A2H5F276_9RHOB|nr:hypothetical protein [Paracoccus zhejiangensis]AUH65636.1 hypothetical protein CX676_17000 [Paracoccus zhejiangensis]